MPAATARQLSPPTTITTTAKGHRVRLTLCIDGTPYSVRPLARADLPFGAVRGFVLSRTDSRLGRVRHAIAEGLDGPVCSCGDATFRQLPSGGECKHVAAARACGLF